MKDRNRKARLRPAKVVRRLFGHLLDCDSYVKAMATVPRDFGTCFGVDFGAEPSMSCRGIRHGKSHADMLGDLAHELSRKCVQTEDSYVRRIVSEFLGRTDWMPTDLHGRCQWIVAEHVNPNIKTFYLDGVALFSMRQHPAIQMHGSRAIADLGIVRHLAPPLPP